MHKLDQLFSTYQRRLAVGAIFLALLGAPIWIGQIRVGNLLINMKTTSDLFKLTEGSIVSAMFATRFFAAYLSAAFTLPNVVNAFLNSLRVAEIIWFFCIIYLATIYQKNPSYKAVRTVALGIFALQGILYILVFYALYAAYNAGSGSEAASILSTLGIFTIVFSLIEACLATGAAVWSLFHLLHEESS